MRDSDGERAIAIWRSTEKLSKKLELLKVLARETLDVVLRARIERRIAFEEDKLSAFTSNWSGEYVYVVSHRHIYGCGYFLKAATAIEYAKRINERNIEKHLVIPGDEIPMVDISKRVEGGAVTAGAKEEKAEYRGHEIASIELDADGDILAIWSSEIAQEGDMLK